MSGCGIFPRRRVEVFCYPDDSVSVKTRATIIAAVDFSSSSPQVLSHAAKLARVSGQELIALHVIDRSRLKDWEETTGQEASTCLYVAEMTQRLRELVAESCDGLEAGISVLIGRPYDVMREVVEEQGADLLILGAHDVSKRRMGPVAARCARSIPADVLILRDWQGQEIRKIAACVDFSQASAVGLGRALDAAEIHKASLEIVHVIYPPARDPWGRVLEQRMDDEASYESVVRNRANDRMEGFLAPFAGRLAGTETKRVVLEGESPAAAITAHVKAEGTDLTVIGSHAGSWMEDFVLGSNSERLIHDSTSSVLIARARKE